jgi:hypothetical protein
LRTQITDYINFHVFESTTDQIRLLEMAGWEQGLWFVCTFLNLAAFGFWVVYMFEIIQVEVDAIKAQQEVRGCVWVGVGLGGGWGGGGGGRW